MIEKRSLPIHSIDRVLNCLRLRWQRTCGNAELLLSPAEYELIPLESIKRYAYLVKNDFAVEALSDGCPRIIELQEFRK